MSTPQLANNKLPKPSTVVGVTLSTAALYFLYSANEKKKRLQSQIHDVKVNFERIKEENMEKLKQAKEEYKCMPAVQEAQQKAREQNLKLKEGKERFQKNKVVFMESMKRDKAYQKLTTTMPDLVAQAEKELDAAWTTLEIMNHDDLVAEILLKNPEDKEEIALTIESCRASMDRVTELLAQEQKSLGWSLRVAGELNDLHTHTKKLKTWIDVTDGMEEASLELELVEPIRNQT